ncbi:GerAB/ArcD/ProY family transporter [Paenibacillus sp. N3.4]|nr:GerAB/ArcD/ProY family transporter [Paenibacillus sp. N3.4]
MTNKSVLTMFVIVHISLYFYVYPVKMIEATSKGHWEPILVGFLTEFTCIWVYLKGLSVFPGEDIVDIFNQVSGKWLARLLLIPLIIYLFLNFNLIHRYEFESVNVLLLPKTPMYFILLLYAIPLYIAWKGLAAISRGGIMLFICVLPMIVFSLISAMNNFDFNNVFPWYDTQLSFFKRPMFYSAFFANTGFIFLGMVKFEAEAAAASNHPSIIHPFYFCLIFRLRADVHFWSGIYYLFSLSQCNDFRYCRH